MSYIKINENDKKIILDDAENIPKTFIDPSDADITAADVARDKIAYGADGKVIGTAELVTEGWYNTQDADVEAEDVMSGKVAYGANGQIIGNYVPLDTTDADATAADIATGKTAYVDGVKITGIANIEPTNWFYVENKDDHDITLRIENNRDAADDRLLTFWTSLDKGVWRYSGVISPGAPFERTIPVGQKMFISGNGAQNGTANSALDGVHITANGLHNIGGDLSSMMQKYPESLKLKQLFLNDSGLINAGDLILPWKILGNVDAFNGMFFGCSSLTTAPALPATSLTEYCYHEMFRRCRSLVNAPALPATTLASGCYTRMFMDCTSLVNAPALPATNIEYVSIREGESTTLNAVYHQMFVGCSSLAAIPSLPASRVGSIDYWYTFTDCTSLTEVRNISATSLDSQAMEGAFQRCSSLQSAYLPATYLAYGAYTNIFENCGNLSYVECHAKYKFKDEWASEEPDVLLDNDDLYIFENWLSNVAPSGELHIPAEMQSFYVDNNLVPAGWTVTTF